MKLNEIVGKEKAEDLRDLSDSIKNGVFTKDGRHLNTINLDVSICSLSSLEGCPSEVKEDFDCRGNELTSLKGGPRKVGGDFFCHVNKLTSLEGCPEEVGGNFFGGSNKITSLKDIHKHLKKMNGNFYMRETPLKSHVLGLLKIPGCVSVILNNEKVQEIINKYLPLGDIFDCQEELIEAGFPEYAQL